ncbi:putative acyl-CoA dehydrogenase [Hyaloraphidium curvatum]|nr:putative acyl-CoA dehydrogenase [Hyaloraphidium curvatum]
MPVFTPQEVAGHANEQSAWIIINQKVYDVTKFAAEHPGGKKILLNVAGKDASKQFATFHSPAVEAQYLPKLLVGEIGSALEAVKKEAAPVAKKNEWLTGDNEVFGDLAPFCEPAWYQDNYSPYYNESHRRLRAFMRQWVDEHIMPYADQWEHDADRHGKYLPKEFHKACGKAGILRVLTGPISWRKGNTVGKIPGVPALPAGLTEDEFDAFHEQIVWDELLRPGFAGIVAGIATGVAYGIPPLVQYGAPEVRDRVVPLVLTGEEQMALAITEPHAGSDVQGILTNGKVSDDGKFFIVNGEKKWITNGWQSRARCGCSTGLTRSPGTFATFFTAAVRTGGQGGAGISMMLWERGPGLTTRHVYTQASALAGTSFVVLEDFKVPVGNLIGKLNEGFKTIMFNFNHERLTIAYQAIRQCRIVYQDALHYAHRRKTFGKNLIEHPVIRDKFAQMARQIEATAAWADFLTHQFNLMPKDLANTRLGGHTSLLKLQCSRTIEFCAREACQIMGGISYTKGGQGGRVERTYREVRGVAIPGGSEEIMADSGIRQALKAAQLMGASL